MSTIRELIDSYAKYAAQHGKLLAAGEYEDNNAVVDAMAETIRELKAQTGEDLSVLKPLLEVEDPTVRRCAAGELLWTCQDDAVAALDALAKKGGLESFLAKKMLEEWKTGNLPPL